MNSTSAGRTRVMVGTVIPGTGADPWGPAILTFEGGLLTAVEAAPPDPELPDGVLDRRSLTAIPGLIDCHTHFISIPIYEAYPELRGTAFETAVQKSRLAPGIPDGLLMAAGVRNALQALRAGVTTARDCGGPGDLPFVLKDAIATGLIPGPRLLVSGPIITRTGGHGHAMGGEADGAVGCRALTRRVMRQGADFIKIALTGGLATAGTNPGHVAFWPEELQAIVDEAHREGRHVAAHILGRDGIQPALEAGVDSLEHVWFMRPDGTTAFDERLLEAMAERGAVCCPTPATEVRLAQRIRRRIEAGVASPEEVRVGAWSEQRVEDNLQIVLRMHEAGIRLLNGTDAGVPYIPFDDYALPLELLVAAGMSPRDAIATATREPAAFLGINAGTLEPGKLADVVLIEGDPYRDVSCLRNVREVWKEGRCVYAHGSPYDDPWDSGVGPLQDDEMKLFGAWKEIR